MDLKTTPLFKEHKDCGAKLAPFAGWIMPIQYSGIITEHNWTRTRASLFDICHMGEFMVYGDPDSSNLNKIISFDLSAMPLKSCRYGFMLNENGGIIDDLIVYKIKPDQWMVVVNAATIDSDEDHLRRNLSSGVRLENVSSELGKLDLQGPFSRDVLMSFVGKDIDKLDYYTFDYFSLEGEENIISRTGYTGELGYELYGSADKIRAIWRSMTKNEGVKPAGLGARDTLRLEMGYSLYGQDITALDTPLEAGLKRYVDFSKDFIGKEALLKQKETCLNKRRIYFITDSRRSPRHNYKIHFNDKEIGIVTSGSFSPSLGCGIGMGYVTADAKMGDGILLKEGTVEIRAIITGKPFYKNATAKSGK